MPAQVLPGTVAAVLPGALFRVTLANGHTVLAAVDVAARKRLIRISPGDPVIVRISPFDFSRGRILGRQEAGDTSRP
ncbi:MAG: translation initiation factor IF-1 [Chloroflexi bacterium]|nr:translation initiation factor IF-1 [Chloroflexota bacterium]